MEIFKNLRVAAKLQVAFGAMILLMAVLGGAAIKQLGAVNDQAKEMRDIWLPCVYHLSEIIRATSDDRRLELRHLVTTEAAGMEPLERRMADAERRRVESERKYEPLITEPEERTLYAEYREHIAAYAAEHARVVELSRSGHKPEALALASGAALQRFESILPILAKLQDIQLTGSRRSGEIAQQTYASGRIMVLVMLSLGVAVGLVFATLVSRGITTPLADSVEVASRLAAGDLTVRVDSERNDELGALQRAMGDMSAKFAATMTDIRATVDSLASAAEQVSSTAESLSQTASEQAASVEETTSSVDQISHLINEGAGQARKTSGLAGQARTKATEGGSTVREAVTAMNDVAGKVSIVDEIASQTNLLALNAAIEAARAGQSGRGFAVVADEVRKLAERSQVAAREIGEITRGTVGQAERAGKILEEIEPQVGETAHLVALIVESAQAQDQGIGQIKAAMGQINRATQQNSAASEELAATSQQLNTQAQRLQGLLQGFRV